MLPDKWEVVESISGTGDLAPKGEASKVNVRYALRVLRRLVQPSPGEFIPAELVIEGKVSSPKDEFFEARNVGKHFTLLLEDGRRLDFFFQHRDGSGCEYRSGSVSGLMMRALFSSRR